MHSPDDLEVIEGYCRRAAAAAVADLIREHGGQLVPLGAAPAAIEPRLAPVARQEFATVRPVLEAPTALTRWERVDKLSLALKVTGVLAGLGAAAAAVWAVVMVVQMVAAAVVPVATGVVGLVLLVTLLSSLGGSKGRPSAKGFSGTFSGRMH